MSDEISKTLYKKVGDAFDVVIKPLNQRMSNPLVGSFAISWTIWNWKPILVILFSTRVIEDKIEYIKDHFYQDPIFFMPFPHIISFNSNWVNYLIVPLFFSCAYIWLMPRIENFIDTTNDKEVEKKLVHAHNYEMRALDRRKIIASEEAAVAEAKSEYKTLLQKDKVIADLNKTVEILKNQEFKLNDTVNELLENSKRIQAENITLNKNRINMNSHNEHQTIVLTSLIDKLIQDLPTKTLNSLEEEMKNFLMKYSDISEDLRNEINKSITDSISLAESKNPLFVLKLEIDEDHLDSREFVRNIVASLFEIISSVQYNDENTMEFVCRFKNPADKPETYDFILDSLPYIISVRFSNPEFLKSGKVRYKP